MGTQPSSSFFKGIKPENDYIWFDMKKLKYLFLLPVFLLCMRTAIADPGHLLVHVPELTEKSIDCLGVWFSSDNNILNAGLCLENKLLLIELELIDQVQIYNIFSILKKKGVFEFYLKEEISLDRFYSNCINYLPIP